MKNDDFSEMIFYYNITHLETIDESEKFVIELDESTWVDYLTGMVTVLSIPKRRFGIKTSLEIPEILKDGNNVSEYSDFIKKSSRRNNVDDIIEMDLIEEPKWSSIREEFYTDGIITSIACFGTNETFDSFRKQIKSNYSF